jgi:hypothetical protein
MTSCAHPREMSGSSPSHVLSPRTFFETRSSDAQILLQNARQNMPRSSSPAMPEMTCVPQTLGDSISPRQIVISPSGHISYSKQLASPRFSPSEAVGSRLRSCSEVAHALASPRLTSLGSPRLTSGSPLLGHTHVSRTASPEMTRVPQSPGYPGTQGRAVIPLSGHISYSGRIGPSLGSRRQAVGPRPSSSGEIPSFSVLCTHRRRICSQVQNAHEPSHYVRSNDPCAEKGFWHAGTWVDGPQYD